MDQKYLPSNRLITIVIVVIAIIGVFFLIQKNKNTKEDQQTVPVLATKEQSSDLEDPDGDGLANWKEVIWKTDPNNPDSDGDGTPDGEEISNNRDPAVPGPNDMLTETLTRLTRDNKPLATTTGPSTQTGIISRTLFENYLFLKQQNIPITPENIELLVLQSGSFTKPEQNVKLYTEKDIKTTETITEQILHEYGNKFAGVIDRNAPGVENEILILARAIENKNPKDLEPLKKTISSYKANGAGLLNIVVPYTVASEHIELINAFLLVARDLEYFLDVFEDPILTLTGFRQYEVDAEKLTSNLNTIVSYLLEETTFFPGESGYLLNNTL